MGIAKLYGQKPKGGMDINGIIRDYHVYAGENISAGDLVEFINGIGSQTNYGASACTQLSIGAYSSARVTAVVLDDTRIFVAHKYNGSNEYLYGVIVTISGANIIVGTDTQLSTTVDSGYRLSATKVNNNAVFIAHSSEGSNLYLNGMVCTVNGTTITAGTDIQLTTTTKTANEEIKAITLNDGSVFIAHNYGSDRYLFAIVCTVSGTTITKGTDTSLYNTKDAGTRISPIQLRDGNIFIAHSYNGSSRYLYAQVCTVKGTTITSGSSKALVSSTYAGSYIETALLDEDDKVLVIHSYSTSQSLNSMVCTISGTTVTAGTDIVLSSESATGQYLSSARIDDNHLFLVHGSSSTEQLHGIIVMIEGTTVTVGTDTPLNSEAYTCYYVPSAVLINGVIFVAHSYNKSNCYLYGQTFCMDSVNKVPTTNIIMNEYETQVRKTTTSQFDGVAKTNGTGGTSTAHKDLVSIYTLERPLPETFVINNDFSSGITGWSGNSANVNLSHYEGYLRMSCSNMSTGNSADLTLSSNLIQNHVYYFSVDAKASTSAVNTSSNGVVHAVLVNSGADNTTQNLTLDDSWHRLSMLFTAKASSGQDKIRLTVTATNYGDPVCWDNVKLCDLTAEYGEGNEPTKEWCDENL